LVTAFFAGALLFVATGFAAGLAAFLATTALGLVAATAGLATVVFTAVF
jgi:hypothetical protein